jgi:hypothetical protein
LLAVFVASPRIASPIASGEAKPSQEHDTSQIAPFIEGSSFADRLKKRQAEQKRRAEEEARVEQEKIVSRTIRLGETKVVGNLSVTPVKIERRKPMVVKAELFSQERPEAPDDEFRLILTLKLLNVSEGQVFSPLGMSEKLSHCTFEDNFGNRHEALTRDMLGMKSYKEQEISEMKPGDESLAILIAEEPKVKNAKEFTWRIYLNTSLEDSKGYNLVPPIEKVVFLKFSPDQIQ